MSFARFVGSTGVASVLTLAGVAALVACSSSSNTGFGGGDSGSSPPVDSGTGGSDTGVGVDSGTTPGQDAESDNDSGTTSGGDSGTCEQPPTLHAESAAGVYCPFSGVNGGADVTCTAGQHCCETPETSTAPSTCEAMGTACPVAGSIDWQCEEAIDCTASGSAGPICCGTGTPTTETACGQTWAEWSGFTGTKCATSCASPGITVCETTADCASSAAGTTCTPSKADGNQFGFCN
jgi:hypothetical protein